MMKQLFSVMLLLIICGCQNNFPKSEQSQLTRFVLPTYGHDNLVNEGVVTHMAGLDGQLRIINGCVGLDYDEQTGKFATIPILVGGSKLIENGTVLQVGQEIFRDGNRVALTGSPSVRNFEISLLPNIPYSPVPEYCHAKAYWFTGYIQHEK